jgi:Barstar (barnase inhibitor)
MTPFHFEAQPSTCSDGRRVVLPPGLAKKADLLVFLQRTLPLPDYFGHNWDALEECLGDLRWLDDPKIFLIHQDIPLENLPADQRTYLEILAGAAKSSDRLSIVFSERDRAKVTQLLSA